MTKKEKRDGARGRLIKKIIDNILQTADYKEIIEGPRGIDLYELMQRDTWKFLLQYEQNYFDEQD